ncbi:methyltransferase domain-containing protein [Prolixibacteraceae bacterium JC049]|nr:methyltransferase domain-containing protein [Prolixibacteraceae bacterium JC049]
MRQKATKPFQFKEFTVVQQQSAMKVNTDSILLGSWADVSEANYVLDIGTGTGLLALMVAQRNTQAIIDAIDIDLPAVEEATLNFSNSKFSDRLNCFHQPLQSFATNSEKKYDLVITNPPYFEEGLVSPDTQRGNARHTNSLSFLDLIQGATQFLNTDGKLAMVIPIEARERIISIAQKHSLHLNRELQVQPTPTKPFNRSFLQFSFKKSDVTFQKLSIYNTNSSYSECFKTYTKLFYLNI